MADVDVDQSRYAQACSQCARVKVKCVRSASASECERCHRLQKTCQPALSKRRLKPEGTRHRVEKTTRPSEDTSRVERKLDELFSLLRTPHSVSPATCNGLDIPGNPTESSGPTDELSPAEAERCLAKFKEQLKYFPFVRVDCYSTATELSEARPLFWLSIRAITTRTSSIQKRLNRRLREAFNIHLIAEPTPSIDLLLALLTYTGWLTYQPRTLNDWQTSHDALKASMIIYAQLALTVVFILELQKGPRSDPPQSTCFHYPANDPDTGIRTMEERRAVLGCFLIASILSSSLKRIESMKWTRHMNESLRELELRNETPLDAVLTQMIRAQLVVEKAGVASWYDNVFDTSPSTTSMAGIYARALQADLEAIQAQRPAHLQQNAFVRAHWYHASMVVHEIALMGKPADTCLDLHHIRLMHACLDAIVAWFNAIYTLPANEFINFSTLFSSQLRHCIGMLFYLTTVDDPGWDKAAVRSRLNVLDVLDTMRSNMFLSAQHAGWHCDDGDDQFGRVHDMMGRLRELWGAKLAQMDAANADPLLDFDPILMQNIEADWFGMQWITGST